jgi:hypothetical protein
MTTQENSPMTDQSQKQFESVLGVEGVEATLSNLGVKVPSSQQRDAIKAVLSLDNCSVNAEFPDGDWGYLLIPLVIESTVASSPGVSVLVAPADKLTSLEEKLSRSSLSSIKAADLAETTGGYEGALVYGTAEEVQGFFNHEVSRATELGRLVIVEATTSDVEAFNDILAKATKRARRPQFVVHDASSLTEEVKKCLKNFFQLPLQNIEHLYYEVDGELLSKPTSLADFIEGERAESSLVYATQPSDADFIEVMLRKRGIPCVKLIGNVPSQRLAQTMAQVKSGKTKALIVTDVSSRSIDPHEFELIVNYAIPSDPEVYVHRTERAGSGESLKKVISLIGPLDRANFHYLQKVVETSFSEIKPPSVQDVAEAQFVKLVAEAKESAKGIPEKTRILANLIGENESRDDIVAFLLASLASAQTAVTTDAGYSHDEREDFGRDRDHREHRDNRDVGSRNNSRNGNDRGPRRSRDGNRQGGGGRHNNNYSREDSQSDGDSAEGGNSPRSRQNDNRREEKPTVRICRIYVESSSDQRLDKDFFQKLVDKNYSESKTPIVRLSSRPMYTFLDIVEEQTDDFIAELENAGGPKGEQLFVRKAIKLSTPVEEETAKDASEDGKSSLDEISTTSQESSHDKQASSVL